MASLDFGPFLLLPPPVRAALQARAEPMRAAQGEAVLREGERSDDAFVLVDGTLRVVAMNESRPLAILSPPALVGEIAVLTRKPRGATVVADTPCSLLRVPGPALRDALASEPLFATALGERVDLLAADALLKRRSPLRDLPTPVVGALLRELRPRTLADGQVLEGRSDDMYLVRRGALQRLEDGALTPVGEFVQRVPDERFAAVGETWLYELRAADVRARVSAHEQRVRKILRELRQDDRIVVRAGWRTTDGSEPDERVVYDGRRRAIVTRAVADLLPLSDGTRDLAALLGTVAGDAEEARRGLAVLIAADLVTVARRPLARVRDIVRRTR